MNEKLDRSTLETKLPVCMYIRSVFLYKNNLKDYLVDSFKHRLKKTRLSADVWLPK